MTKQPAKTGRTGTPTALFFSMGIDMSWRLALSVLVPIIGGVYLDKAFDTAPALLITGFVLAIVLSTLTVRRTLKLTSKLTFVAPDHKRGEADE